MQPRRNKMASSTDPSKRFRLEDLQTEGAVWFFSADEVQAAFWKLNDKWEEDTKKNAGLVAEERSRA